MDNLEEDIPALHDILRTWVPHTELALLIYGHDAGFRLFLGADPAQAGTLKELCDQQVTLTEFFVTRSPCARSGRAARHCPGSALCGRDRPRANPRAHRG